MSRFICFALALCLSVPAAMAAPSEASQVEAPAAAPTLEITRLAFGTEVEKRRLVGEASQFTIEGQRIFAYMVVHNPSGPPQTLTMVWLHEGKRKWSMDLEVGRSKAWRTWSRMRLKRPRQAGAWTVQVLDAEGHLLTEAGFEALAVEEDAPGGS